MLAATKRSGLYAFLVPVSVLMGFTLAMPLGFVVYNSFGSPSGAFGSYVELVTGRLFQKVVWTTLEIAFFATLLSLLLGYPIALQLSRVSNRTRAFLLIFVMLPFWTSILVKSYAFIVVLGEQGILNRFFLMLGFSRVPMMFNRVGVMVGMTNFLIPFVVFPLLASLLAQNSNLRRAAAVMGASDYKIFWSITFPLSVPGLMAGGIMSFVISLGFFVTPALLGGRQDMMVANLIDFYTRETLDWPAASAISVILLAVSGLLIWTLGKIRGENALL